MIFYSKIRQYIMKSDFLKSISVLFSGNLIANAISFASVPIISRIYNQESFGEYAVLTSLATILTGIASLGLNSAIMAPKNDDESKEILTTTCITEVLIISALFIIGLFINYIYDVTIVSFNIYFAMLLLFLYTVVLGAYYLLSVYTNRCKLNRVLFGNALINALAMFLFAIPLGLIGMKGDGLLLAAILGYSIADVHMIIKTRPFLWVKYLKSIKVISRKYKDFILFQYPSNTLGVFSQQIPNQFFSKFFGNANLGGYAMCERILGVPMRLIGNPINTVYFRHASIYVKEGRDLSYFTYQLVVKMLYLSFIPVIVLFLFSKQIFTFILGSGWEDVGEIVTIFIVPYFLTFCSSCITYCLVVIDKQRVNLVLAIFHLLLLLLSLIGGWLIWGDFKGTIIFYSYGVILIKLTHLMAIFYYLKKHFYRFCMIISAYLGIIYTIKYVILHI